MTAQQKLLHEILDLTKDVFERKLNEKSNDFSFDDEKLEKKIRIKGEKFRATISKYERENYYVLRTNVNGDDIVISGYSNGIVSSYVDDNDYGSIEKLDIGNCLNIIYEEMRKFLN